MGTLFKRNGGKVWWMQYYQNGLQIRKSTGTTKKMVATEILKRVESDIAQGKIPFIEFQKVTFDQLADNLIRNYEINQKKSTEKVKRSVKHLKRKFSGWPVTKITTPEIDKFILMRLKEGRANATVNRELAALKRMMNLGAKQTPPLVDKVPHIEMLKENNVRKGFFEHAEFLAIREALPDYLYGIITFGYKFGWRVDEIRRIEWSQVDRTLWTVRVDNTKNDNSRTVYLDEELKGIFSDLWEKRKERRVILPYVFMNKARTDHVKCFRKAWDAAFVETGLERRIFHDLRRTAVRNMVRAGIPENIAMKISGHKTRSVFDRYDIVNDRDLKKATLQQENYMREYASDPEISTGDNTGCSTGSGTGRNTVKITSISTKQGTKAVFAK